MKNILIVNASKRRIGNSYTLEKRIAEQLEGKAETFAHVWPVTAASASTRPTAFRRTTLPL